MQIVEAPIEAAMQFPRCSRHAVARMQQRAMPPFAIHLLLNFATERRSHGASVYAHDKTSRRRVRDHLGGRGVKLIEPLLDAYVVLAEDGSIITAGWRTHRLRRA
jgi:hypothetical protein